MAIGPSQDSLRKPRHPKRTLGTPEVTSETPILPDPARPSLSSTYSRCMRQPDRHGMDLSLRFGTPHRRTARPADPPCSHPGDEWRKLPACPLQTPVAPCKARTAVRRHPRGMKCEKQCPIACTRAALLLRQVAADSLRR